MNACVKTLVAALIVISVEGCVSHYAKLEEPESKTQLVCHNSGWGWIGAPMAMYNQSACVEQLQEKGYVVIEER